MSTAKRDEAFRHAALNAAAQVPGTILVTLAGSHAYRMDHPGSDLDIMGVYVAPTRDVLSLRPPKPTYRFSDRDVTFYELHQFAKLAAGANPTVLEVFAAPVLFSTFDGDLLREMSSAFLSRLAHKTYGGYAMAQISKAEKGTGGSRGVEHLKREKFLMHTLRLLVQGTALLETGEISVHMDPETVLDLRAVVDDGLERVAAHATGLLAALDVALTDSPLPERPNHEAITDIICLLRGVV